MLLTLLTLFGAALYAYAQNFNQGDCYQATNSSPYPYLINDQFYEKKVFQYLPGATLP